MSCLFSCLCAHGSQESGCQGRVERAGLGAAQAEKTEGRLIQVGEVPPEEETNFLLYTQFLRHSGFSPWRVEETGWQQTAGEADPG